MVRDELQAQQPKRVLPHNLDAEMSVLGGILLRNECLTALPELEVDDFYDPRHKQVFGAMRNLEAAHKPIDPVTLEVELEKRGVLDPIGGVAFLGQLALRVPTPENVEHYAAIVRETSVSRRAMLVLSEFIEYGYRAEEGYRGDDLIAETMGALMRIESGRKDPVVTFGDAAKREIQRIENDIAARDRGEQVLIGMPTGLRGVDEKVGGIPFSVVTGVLARPACGKSTLADHLCLAAEMYGNDIPLLFTFEDSEQSFAQRRIAGASGVATTRVRARNLDRAALDAIVRSMPVTTTARGLLIRCAGWTVEQIVRCARAIRGRSHHYAKNTGKTIGRMMCVDYLQKVRNPDWARGNRNIGLGWVCEVLSNYAQDEEAAVVLFSQVNRETEKSEDNVPRLHEARDSGEYEQHIKFALGLKRPWMYDEHADPCLLEAHVLKNHNGPANGVIQVYWEVETHSLANTPLDLQQRRMARRAMP